MSENPPIKPFDRTIVSEKMVYENRKKVKAVDVRFGNGIVDSYEVTVDGVAVVALALTHNNQVLLTKIYRAGPDKVLTEMPGVVRQLDGTSFGGVRQLDGTRFAPVRWDHLWGVSGGWCR